MRHTRLNTALFLLGEQPKGQMIDIGKWGENVQMERGTEEEKGEGGKGKGRKTTGAPPHRINRGHEGA